MAKYSINRVDENGKTLEVIEREYRADNIEAACTYAREQVAGVKDGAIDSESGFVTLGIRGALDMIDVRELEDANAD